MEAETLPVIWISGNIQNSVRPRNVLIYSAFSLLLRERG